MGTPPRDRVASAFAFDGSWRDIYVFYTDIRTWQDVLDRLRQSYCEIQYRRNGTAAELPSEVAEAFPTDGNLGRTLAVRFAGVVAVCHFFSLEEIEFDIDPREVRGQEQLDAVLGFMQLLADSSGRDAVLTQENAREATIFRVHPHGTAVEYESGECR